MERKTDQAIIDRLKVLLNQYRSEILASNYSMNSKASRSEYARRFVDWIAGEYDPGAYDGSYGSR